jgi:hypothetical protein
MEFVCCFVHRIFVSYIKMLRNINSLYVTGKVVSTKFRRNMSRDSRIGI